jgi:hypothetical protein
MRYCTRCQTTVSSKAEYYADNSYSKNQCSSCGNSLLDDRETSLVLKSKGDELVSLNSDLKALIALGQKELEYKNDQISITICKIICLFDN